MMERFSIAMCAFCAHGGSLGLVTVALVGLLATLAQAWTALLALAGMGPDQQKRPPADRRALSEPPKGIEPLTYSLRVNRSGRLS